MKQWTGGLLGTLTRPTCYSPLNERLAIPRRHWCKDPCVALRSRADCHGLYQFTCWSSLASDCTKGCPLCGICGDWTQRRVPHWASVRQRALVRLVNFADLIGARRLRAWPTVLGLGALLSLVLALAGLAVLIQGLMHSGIYKPSMALLYALWITCLWILPLSSIVIDDASKQLYSR